MWWLLVQAAVAGQWHFGASVGGGGGFEMASDTGPAGMVEAAAEFERELPKASLYLSIPVRLTFEDLDPVLLSGLHVGALARVGKGPVRGLFGGGGAALGGLMVDGGDPYFTSRLFGEGRLGLEYQAGKGPAWQLWFQPELGAAPNQYGLAPYAGLQVRTGIRF